MLLSYLKLSLRLFLRDPFFTLIKVFGLAVGFTVFFMIWPYATAELKTDQFHKDFERIVRVGLHLEFLTDGINWGDIRFGAVRPYHIPMMESDLGEIEAYTRFLAQPEFNNELVGHGTKVIVAVYSTDGSRALFKEDHLIYADPNLFEFFAIPLILGSNANVLEKPNSVVLSQSKANAYFGNENPVGQILALNDSSVLLTVTGVFQDLPDNTHLNFDLVISNSGVEKNWQGLNGFPAASCYMKISSSTGIDEFEKAINRNKEKYMAEDMKIRPAAKVEFFVQPLTEISFGPMYGYDFFFKKKSKSTLILLQIVAMVILLMAWSNYINLTLSRMRKRMKEIATRKVSGAISTDFFRQFVVESSALHLLAVTFAFTLIQLMRTPSKLFLGIQTMPFGSIDLTTWLVFLLAILAGILLTGLYPALMSVSFSTQSLFSYARGGQKGRSLTLLTTGQYTAAVALVLLSFMATIQLNYILHKDLGFDRDQVVIVEAPFNRSATYLADVDAFMNVLRSSPGVLGATWSIRVVTDPNYELITVFRGQGRGEAQMGFHGAVDESYIPFYRISVFSGRNFQATDRNAMILSRYATQRLGYKNPEDAIGDQVEVDWHEGQLQVVGVIEDYRVNSLLSLEGTSSEEDTGSGIVLIYKGFIPSLVPEKLSIKLETIRIDQTIDEMKKQFNIAFPVNVFEWYFLDDRINAVYGSERNARNQIIVLTGLAIFISCLGLLGMMTTLVAEKTKEIGVRKVLGAELLQIGALLLKTTIKQLFIAMAIGIPLAYFLIQKYLEKFLDHIILKWWHYGLPIAVLVSILLSTIAYMLWKAARSNPVEALKYE